MAPGAIIPEIVDYVQPKKDNVNIPGPTRARLEKAGIDLSNGYPVSIPIPSTIKKRQHWQWWQYRPAVPLFLQDVYAIRNEDREYIDAGTRADKNKTALFSAAKEVKNLTAHIGTEIVGLQLKDLTDQQRDELALLIAERSVVFFRDQDLSPQKQLELGKYFGEVEIHPQVPHVPGLQGTTVIWPDLMKNDFGASFRKPVGTQGWHTDLYFSWKVATTIHYTDNPPASTNTNQPA
jgi:hypothetical protein